MKGIYRILSPENEAYIGQSLNIEQRFKQHKNRSTKKHRLLRASFDRHGYAKHSFSVLHELPFDASMNVFDDYERFYIDLHRSAGFGILNLKDPGIHGKHCLETINLMRGKHGKWMIGRKLSPETIAKRTAKQRTRSQSWKDAMSLRMKGKGNPMYGKHTNNK